MPPVNLYFDNFSSFGEQELIEELTIEAIQIYGIECWYMPRTLVKEDDLYGEDILSMFKRAYEIEMYIKNVSGFEGEGDFLSKFNIQIRGQMTLTVSRRRFGEEITPDGTTKGSGRPVEGDLIYFPLNGKIFEVKFVEHEAIFYQMGSLQTYDLRCELFEYSSQRIETGVQEIDNIEKLFSSDQTLHTLDDVNSQPIELVGGGVIELVSYDIKDSNANADNKYFKDNVSFVNKAESTPSFNY